MLKAVSPQLQESSDARRAAMMTINLDVKGLRFGHLTAQYRSGALPHRISCRCACGNLIHVSAADLASGAINSCGCKPPPPFYWARQAEFKKQLERENLFRQMLPLVSRGGR